MNKRHLYIAIGVVLLACASACVTVYVQKDNTNSTISTSDTSENSADSASIDMAFPLEVFE